MTADDRVDEPVDGFAHVFHLALKEAAGAPRWLPAYGTRVVFAGAFLTGFEMAMRFAERYPDRVVELSTWIQEMQATQHFGRTPLERDVNIVADLALIATEPKVERPIQ